MLFFIPLIVIVFVVALIAHHMEQQKDRELLDAISRMCNKDADDDTSIDVSDDDENAIYTDAYAIDSESMPMNALYSVAGASVMRCSSVTLNGMGMAPYVSESMPNTEAYRNFDESGFRKVVDDPLSTVSADVDTASYCAIRAKLSGHGSEYWMNSDDNMSNMCRTEEMINYFTYDYDMPETDTYVNMTSHLVICPWNKEHQLLQLGFATGKSKMDEYLARNIVLLVDVSGSMSDTNKLDLAKIGLKQFAETLTEKDRLSLVTYSSGESVVFDGMSADDYASICNCIDALQASGATYGEAGLKMAYELAEKHFVEGGVNRIVMVSDGDLNVGMQSATELHDYVKSKRDTGIYLSVLGFGLGNYKDINMSELGDSGNGAYHYIDCEEECERIFVRHLTKNLVPFADDMKVQVEFNPACVSEYRLIGYEKRELANSDFKNDDVNAANVGPEEQFTICYEIVRVTDEDVTTEMRYQKRELIANDELCAVSVRYRLFDDGEIHEQLFTVEDILDEELCSDTAQVAAVIECSELLRKSKYAGTCSTDDASELAKLVTSSDVEELKLFVKRCAEWLEVRDAYE